MRVSGVQHYIFLLAAENYQNYQLNCAYSFIYQAINAHSHDADPRQFGIQQQRQHVREQAAATLNRPAILHNAALARLPEPHREVSRE